MGDNGPIGSVVETGVADAVLGHDEAQDVFPSFYHGIANVVSQLVTHVEGCGFHRLLGGTSL